MAGVFILWPCYLLSFMRNVLVMIVFRSRQTCNLCWFFSRIWSLMHAITEQCYDQVVAHYITRQYLARLDMYRE